MAATIEQLLHAHPTNPVEETGYESSSNKAWTRNYKPIVKVTVHTFERNGAMAANFDAFVPEQADDQHRKSLGAYPPNPHCWRMDTEADARHWFYHEVSDTVMAAFASAPPLVQVAEAKAFSDQHVAHVVDESFTFKTPRSRIPLVIGEFKRNILLPGEWQRGKIVSAGQLTLSRELRGYAVKYECPQVFCFDGYSLLMLQFKAKTLEAIAHEDCRVDCWFFPRENAGGVPLRYAFYRLLVQGLRRCQGQLSPSIVTLNGQQSEFRNFYTGEPVWEIDDSLHRHPWGMYRAVDPRNGSMYWMFNGQEVLDESGQRLLDGPPLYNY
ncbi:hypothetical protein A9K55_006902 [Cordyceps militaris]|uniref:Uncharacterized protein n=1 Tax=Cordyceps militaris TaxID=73501 RepID=A0A2H4SBD1_CORMI|nr:hypothetical protein A9K55_006902 [Cordyceps militaris]